MLKHYMHSYADPRVDRVVMLGTPITGSDVAREFGKHELPRLLLGRSVKDGLLGGAPPWPAGRPLAMIAGDRTVGLDTLVKSPKSSVSDGTVFLHETQSKEVTHHYVAPVGHTALLFSRRVVRAIVSYLKFGDFDHLR